jgi:hypothetical protein
MIIHRIDPKLLSQSHQQMNLHVVAYPQLQSADYERIQLFRRNHNTLFSVIEPHFTLVFAVPDLALEDFTAEVKKHLAGIHTINFCLRCAVINKDSFSNNYDAFLVPDEGHSRIVKLHDQLYADKLSKHHRLDIPYIPHVSIANSPDAQNTKRIVDEWNSEDFAIDGVIMALDIVNYENRVITTLERIDLQII